MLWWCHENTKKLAFTMLLINTYGTVTDAPGTSAGSDGSNVSATSAQSVQESSPVELSDEDLIAKAARVKAL